MAEWVECTIGDLCETISDTYKGNDEKVILVNTSDILEGKVLNHIEVQNKNLKGQFKKTFRKNDILFSEIRPANKRFAFIDFEDTSNYIASTKLMVLRHNEKVLPEYLFAILKSNYILAELQHLAETRSGTFPQITFTSELAPMKVNLPDKKTQKRIVSILSSIEQKIDVNETVNNNLEQQVSILYQSWFEDFEITNGVCPEDWSYQELSSIADIASGKRPLVKSNVCNQETPISIVGAASVMGFTSEANHTDKILVTGRVGTHGVVQRFNTPCWTSDNTLVITSPYYEFTNQILHRIDYSSMNRGSTQPLITQGDIKKVVVLVPDENTLAKFEEFAGSLMVKWEANNKENIKLASLRDTLLPKLMSGELDVSDIEL